MPADAERVIAVRTRPLPPELGELLRAVERLPNPWRGRLLPLWDGVNEWSQRQARLVQAAQEAVDQLRLDIKCLRFDLDMTRRERVPFASTKGPIDLQSGIGAPSIRKIRGKFRPRITRPKHGSTTTANCPDHTCRNVACFVQGSVAGLFLNCE